MCNGPKIDKGGWGYFRDKSWQKNHWRKTDIRTIIDKIRWTLTFPDISDYWKRARYCTSVQTNRQKSNAIIASHVLPSLLIIIDVKTYVSLIPSRKQKVPLTHWYEISSLLLHAIKKWASRGLLVIPQECNRWIGVNGGREGGRISMRPLLP